MGARRAAGVVSYGISLVVVFALGCGTDGARARVPIDPTPRDSVDGARVWADVTFVAQERVPGSQGWRAVRDLCKTRFEQDGFEVELQSYGTGVNVIGRKRGTTRAAEEVLVSAHYDHIAGCAGADDDATGVAGVLEAARALRSTAFARTLVVACWDEEERQLLGSKAYAARAAQRGEKISVMYSFEMLGYRNRGAQSQRLPRGFDVMFPAQAASLSANGARGDFLAIVPNTPARAFAERIAFHAAAIGLPVVVLELSPAQSTSELSSDVRRSDHASFWDQGTAAILATDTAEFRYGGYHCMEMPDVVSNLDRTFLTLNVRALVGSIADALNP